MRPTRAQAAVFHRQIRKWQTRLNLGDWRIERGRGLAPGVMAQVDARDLSQRAASYRLGAAFDEITDHELDATALHEVLHVFLHELVELARDRKTSPDTLMAAEHRVINVLVPLLMEPPPDALPPR